MHAIDQPEGNFPNSADPRPWPPREGRRFFSLWMAGIIAQTTLGRVITIVSQYGTSPSVGPGNQVTVVFVVLAVALGTWQAWLLFPRGWRFFLWILILLPILAVTYLIIARPSSATTLYYQAALFVGMLMRFPLLIGVRRHPWLYLLGGLGERLVPVVLNIFFVSAIYSLSNRIAVLLPLASTSLVFSAFYSGTAILASAVTAALLAWRMPPIPQSSTR